MTDEIRYVETIWTIWERQDREAELAKPKPAPKPPAPLWRRAIWRWQRAKGIYAYFRLQNYKSPLGAAWEAYRLS